MTTSGYLTSDYLNNLTAPFNDESTFAQFLQTDLGQEIISKLWVNRDKTNPDFGQTDVTFWDIGGIPTSIVGIQVDAAREYALVYYAGLPDYVITEPGVGNEPTNIYGILKIPLDPIAETDIVHELTSSSDVGIFINGSGIFSYTDTFSWQNEGAWSYDAFVAEAASINDDGAHSTPTGEFHNHIQSADVLEELEDPFALGVSEHSLLIGYGIDGNPVYGPLGYTTTDGSGELEVLRSSYVKRDWLENTSGNRSSLPEWAVANWDGQSASSTSILNLFGKAKSDVLYSDGVLDGVVTYTGTDTALATEIAYYSDGTNGYTLKEDASGYAYWENTVTLPDNSGTAETQNYLLKSSDLWGPGYDETIQPGLYPIDRIDEFSFTAAVGSFAEDYAFVEGYGDLDFYNGIDSYIPDLGKSQYHYVTSFSSDLADTDRLTGVAFPYVLGVQYKSEIDTFNTDTATKTAFLSDPNNGLETVYDLGITDKDDNGNLISGSIIDTWQAEQTVVTGGPPGGVTVNTAPSGSDKTISITENTPYTFTSADVGFSDSDGNNLSRIEITTLPGQGTLTLNGATVSAGDFISVLDFNQLTYTPASVGGNSNDSFTFQVEDDGGTANGGINLDQTPNTFTFNISSSGSSTGDPHIVTFDNLYYDFQAQGDFILVKAFDSDLEVQVRQAAWEQNPAVTLNVGLATVVDGQQLEFSIDQSFPLINGIPTPLEIGETLSLGQGSISRSPINGYGTLGDLYTITYPNGDQLFANVYADFLIDPTVRLKGSQTVVGLLGNNNGQIEDDLALLDGTVSPQAATPEYLLSEFATSWQVIPDNSLFGDQALPLNSKLAIGTVESDSLFGGESNDILVGSTTSQSNLFGEIDLFTGYQGADTFVLGNTKSIFYAGAGVNDYAVIQDFSSQQGDIIQLKGSSSDYVLNGISNQYATGTGIFLASNSTELVGIVNGIEPQDLLLSQSSFQYI
jgi:YHYH protein/von Willebrand factor type D domain